MPSKQSIDDFKVIEGDDTMSPKVMIEMPRPGTGTPNTTFDLAFISVSTYSFERDKTEKKLYVIPLDPSKNATPIKTKSLLQVAPDAEGKLEGGGEAFWLGAATIGYIIEDKSSADSNGREKNAKADATRHALYAIPIVSGTEAGKPSLIGHFPPAISPSNVRYSEKTSILVFSANVYTDGDLQTVQKQDEAYEKRGNTAMVYDATYVRHWDEWVGPKSSALFTVSVKKEGQSWKLGGSYGAPLKGTSHNVPVRPFGGAEDYYLSEKLIIYTTIDPDHSQAWHTRQNIYVVPLSTDSSPKSPPKQLTSGKQGGTHYPNLSPSGVWAAWLEREEDGYESDRTRIVLSHVESGRRVVLKELDKWDRSPSSLVFNLEGNALWMSVEDDGYSRVYKLELPGEDVLEKLVSGQTPGWPPSPVAFTKTGGASGLAPLPDNKLLFSLSTLTGPNELHLLTAPHKATQLTEFAGSHLSAKANLKLDPGEAYWFEGDKGIKVQGWIHKPKGFDKSKKWPAIMLVHGGPQGAWNDSWSTRWNPNVFAQQGYFVISINPTGSTGFGQGFTDAITKNWGDAPFVDLQKGWAEALRKYPEIDPERTAASGGSWGGYAMFWLAGHPEYSFKFKTLIPHAGVFDVRNMGFITEEVFFYNHDFGGVPWKGLGEELGNKWNPINFVDKWTIPMLCIHGSKDYRLAEIESLGAFNALQQKGIPSRLVVFPDENHWILKPGNSLHWHYEIFRWLNEFIGRGGK